MTPALEEDLQPAVIQILQYPPSSWCDLENKFDQEAFGGIQTDVAREIIENTGWAKDRYDVSLYCICCFDDYISSYITNFHEDEHGMKYLFSM